MASRGSREPGPSNIPSVFQPNSNDKEKDKDNGKPIDHASATRPVSLKSPNVLATPSPSTPPTPLNTQDKVQRFKNLAASLTSTITSFEKSLERANVERYLVKVTALELKREIDDVLKDDTEWTVESTSRRAAKFEPLLRKFSKSWQTDLPASLGVKEETSRTIERTETMLLELNERLSPTTNGTGKLSGT
jgi:hypothetical protein